MHRNKHKHNSNFKSVASQLIQEVTAYAQSDSLEDAREICADGTYLPNNLRRTYGGILHARDFSIIIKKLPDDVHKM